MSSPSLHRSESATGDPCILCGASTWTPLREGHDLCRRDGDVTYLLARCVACSHVMQQPQPGAEELRDAYSADYTPYRPGWKKGGLRLWRVLRNVTTWRRIRRLRNCGRGSDLLEIGCGAGDFLRQAHRLGWNVKAAEYNPELAALLRRELNFDVRDGELRSGLWPPASFDVVVMWSVLEHMPDPLHGLTLAAAYLRPGGILLIQIPTASGVRAGSIFGEHWVVLDFPRHLNFFSRSSLADLLSHAGLEPVLFRTPFLDTAWCYCASAVSLIGKSRGLARLARAAFFALFLFLSIPAILFRSWTGKGTEAFAMAVKR
ncbi:MAG: class I SAM-dependent methyltransferase [Acidobacteriaceae bacterium]